MKNIRSMLFIVEAACCQYGNTQEAICSIPHQLSKPTGTTLFPPKEISDKFADLRCWMAAVQAIRVLWLK
jgi:hypothetical protein